MNAIKPFNSLKRVSRPAMKIEYLSRPPENILSSFGLGGIPYAETGETWPYCQRCGLPMRFGIQLAQSEHNIIFAPDWQLLVVFGCGDFDCITRSRPGVSGKTLEVRTYASPSLDKVEKLYRHFSENQIDNQRDEQHPAAIRFSPFLSLPTLAQIEKDCDDLNANPFDILNEFDSLQQYLDTLHYYLRTDLERYRKTFHFCNDRVGGYARWDNCVERTPQHNGRAMQPILQAGMHLGEISACDIGILFADIDANYFEFVIDGT